MAWCAFTRRSGTSIPTRLACSVSQEAICRSVQARTREGYTPVDAADKESCRPTFACAYHPGHLIVAARMDASKAPKKFRSHSATPIKILRESEVSDPQTPLLSFQNEDDTWTRKRLRLLTTFPEKAGVPVECIIYAQAITRSDSRTNFP